MTTLKYRFISILTSVAILSILFACSSQTQTVTAKAAVEVWEVQLSGQTVGRLKMNLQRYKIENEIQSFKGKLTGPIKDHRGGFGDAEFRLKGKINKNIFTTSIGGYADMTEGPSTVSGSMNGKIISSQGSGTWRITHALGISTGKFTMKQLAAPQ
jgi:hypothetical protein